jgi:pimeloyl-ACP methyl ester carboxylesterase
MSPTAESKAHIKSRVVQPADWRSEYPFDSRFLEFPCVGPESHGGPNPLRMHYVDEGPKLGDADSSNRSTILCVHGNPTWSFYYRSIVSRFRSSHRVVAVDHIGCGLSDKPQQYRYTLAQHTENLIALIDELDLQNITLVVHDWGGAIGLGAAVQRPDRFRKMMILNTGAFPPTYIPRRIAACRIPILGSLAIRYGNLFARTAIYMAIDRLPKLSDHARQGLLAPYDSPAHRVAIDSFVRDIPMSPSHPTWRVLEKLEQDLPMLRELPIRFVWGMRDWCFRPECMERMNRCWPNATRLELSDVGHYVMEEAPSEVLSELAKLLEDGKRS